ncbi:MAG: PKD domain-containing protein, partial [Bacteroidia bacterium]|nr:PKD domain-containing protein [Bacteroidia bacterium]
MKQNISNVTINTYNAGSNASQFVPNYTLDYQDIAWGGYTTRISNTFSVVPCQTYTVKIAIADAGDPALDSGVMIEDAISPCPPVIFPTASVADTCNKGSGQVTITKPNDDCHHVYAINWTNPGVVNTSTVIIPGPNGSNSTLISGLTAGTYTANVQLTILPCNTVYNYSLSVTVGNIGVGPTAAFSFTPGCHLAPVGFTDLSISLSASDPITSWDWDFDNNGTNESVLQNPAYTYPSAGTYLTRLTIRSQSGCRSSVIHTLTVNALPSAAFSASNACVNTAVTFSNTSSAALPATLSLYNWSFGPGSNPSFSNVLSPANVSYNMPGIKTITLQVISSQSCT